VRDLAEQQGQQGRFAAAVRTADTDLVAPADFEADAGKQDSLLETDFQVTGQEQLFVRVTGVLDRQEIEFELGLVQAGPVADFGQLS